MLTWISAANSRYSSDLNRLGISLNRFKSDDQQTYLVGLGDAHWQHTVKFHIIREFIKTAADTDHLFWIDADCELIEHVVTSDITMGRPLTAVRHFCLSHPYEDWSPSFKAIAGEAPPDSIYCQACVFGGTVAAMKVVLQDVAWLEARGETCDEYMLNWYWNLHREQLLVLPCRYASPVDLNFFPEPRRVSYHERADGAPVIIHHNRSTRGF